MGVPEAPLQSEFSTWLWRPKAEEGTQDRVRAEMPPGTRARDTAQRGSRGSSQSPAPP